MVRHSIAAHIVAKWDAELSWYRVGFLPNAGALQLRPNAAERRRRRGAGGARTEARGAVPGREHARAAGAQALARSIARACSLERSCASRVIACEVARRPGPLEIEPADAAVAVEDLAGEVQARQLA